MTPSLQQWRLFCTQSPALAKTVADARAILRREQEKCHGRFPHWLMVIERLARELPDDISVHFDRAAVCAEGRLAPDRRAKVEAQLAELMPWRKGPFSLCGISVDSEWRSDWKYRRLLDAGLEVAGKAVLDVGAGNGYFLYRLLGSGARLALGLDPSWLYFAQFLALQRFLRAEQAVFLPTTLSSLPLGGFAVTLCLGVLYHRRDPLDFLDKLRETIAPGGLLALETLVVEGDARTVYLPKGRYVGMRNVWFLPSRAALCRWLSRLGFRVEWVGEAVRTTTQEQRRTRWMTNASLGEFLTASAAGKGPATPPCRAIVLARRC